MPAQVRQPTCITCPAASWRMRCGVSSRPISAITTSSSPGLMWVMNTSAGCVELRQFRAQQRRAEVAADAGEFDVLVAEGGLDDQRGHAHLRQPFPQRRVGPGVAAEDPGAAAASAHCAARQSRPPARCDAAGSTSICRPPNSSTWPTAIGTKRSTGCAASGRREKSGQITPLKTCVRSASSVCGQRMHVDRRPAAARRAAAPRCRPAGRWPARGPGASG